MEGIDLFVKMLSQWRRKEGQEFRGAIGKLIAIENSLFDKINSYIVILWSILIPKWKSI